MKVYLRLVKVLSEIYFTFLILDLSKEYDVILYVVVIQVIRCDRDMTPVTSHRSHNHVTQRRF